MPSIRGQGTAEPVRRACTRRECLVEREQQNVCAAGAVWYHQEVRSERKSGSLKPGLGGKLYSYQGTSTCSYYSYEYKKVLLLFFLDSQTQKEAKLYERATYIRLCAEQNTQHCCPAGPACIYEYNRYIPGIIQAIRKTWFLCILC